MVDVCYPDGTDWSCAYAPEEIAALDPLVVERSEALAWSVLSSLTGYRASICPVTIRPCAKRCSLGTWDVAPAPSENFGVWGTGGGPFVSGGSWYNSCGCAGPSDCSCSTLCEVIMPGEVGAITEIWMDGALVAPEDYRTDNGNKVVLLNGACFPSCQDMTISDPLEGGVWITYYPGIAPNDLLRYAAGVLAVEFYLACSGKDCRLPTGVTGITRAGVSMEIASGSFPGGMTGIPEVDAVIRVYNPFGIKARPRVMSPDRTRGRINTWSA